MDFGGMPGVRLSQNMDEELEALIALCAKRIPRAGFDARAYRTPARSSSASPRNTRGLGWLAKNTCLINENWLMAFFSANRDDSRLEVSLGHVEIPRRICVERSPVFDACRRAPLVEPYILDARRCIRYLTIELRDPIPVEMRAPIGRHVFGCDICQDVVREWPRAMSAACRISSLAAQSKFAFFPGNLGMADSLSEGEFPRMFRGSPVNEPKWRRLGAMRRGGPGNSGLGSGQIALTRNLRAA